MLLRDVCKTSTYSSIAAVCDGPRVCPCKMDTAAGNCKTSSSNFPNRVPSKSICLLRSMDQTQTLFRGRNCFTTGRLSDFCRILLDQSNGKKNKLLAWDFPRASGHAIQNRQAHRPRDQAHNPGRSQQTSEMGPVDSRLRNIWCTHSEQTWNMKHLAPVSYTKHLRDFESNVQAQYRLHPIYL